MRRIWLGVAGLLTVLVMSAFAARPAAAHPSQQFGRPNLPNAQTVGTEHFLIHYTFSGRSAISPEDADGSGVPDYVERVAETLEYVWRVQIDEMGWPPPASDGTLGGDDRLDVYLEEILEEGYAGYVDTEGGFLGDNPLTPELERRAAFTYMVLDDDYAETDPSAGETPIGLMQATVAHEFNHALQAGIDDRDLHAWLYEAAATWMEDEVYDDINDGVFYLNSIYQNPDICLVAEVARGDDLHWYGTWLLLRMMSERYGQDFVRTVWENMRQYSGFAAVDTALAVHGSALTEESRDFAVANLLRAYEEGDLYPAVRVEGEAGEGRYTPADGVQSLGADYIRLTGRGSLTVTLEGAGAPLSLRAVGVRGGEADIVEMAGNSLTIDSNLYTDTYLVVHNAEEIAHEDECTFASYSLDITAGGAAPTAVASVWPASGFVLPADAPVAGTDGGTGSYRPPDAPFANSSDEYSTSPENLNVGFETLIPASLPPGYSFDYGYIMTAQDFGESAPYYVPAGGETANFDYLDQQGNWLSIAESPSPYGTLKQWIEDIGYTDTPGEIRSINGVPVLVEDLTESGEVWISATLILDGLFIVVDGDYTESDVLQLVDGLIEGAGAAQPPDAGQSPTEPPGASPTAAPVPTQAQPPFAPTATSPLGNLPLAVSSIVGIVLVGVCCMGVLVVGVVAAFFWLRRR